MAPVALGHVGGVRREAVANVAARVRGHALGVEEHLERPLRRSDVELSARQLVGHRVVVALELDVVVDVDPRLAPRRELVALGWQGTKRWSVEALEQLGAGPVHLLEPTVVDDVGALRDRDVGLGQRREAPVSQSSDDPALGELDARFGLGLVAWAVGAGGDDGHRVVRGHLLEGGVDVGLVAMGGRHRALQVVGHDDLGGTAEGLERVDVAGDPVLERLAAQRLGEQVAGRTEHRDEELGVEGDGGARRLVDRDGHPGEVDEELLARSVVLAHDHVDVPAPLSVEVGELAVAEAVRVRLSILDPQELEGHALLSQLGMDVGPVG